MFARTSRLTLRPGWPEDAPALAQAIAHESVVTKVSRAPWPYTVDDARAFLARPTTASDAALLITAIDRGTPRIIGCIGVHPDGDTHELGYWLTPDAWGRGYATEAACHMVQTARWTLGLKRLRAGHFVDNPASARVLAKVGFRPTGQTERQFCRARGHEVECVKLEIDLDPQRAMPMAA